MKKYYDYIHIIREDPENSEPDESKILKCSFDIIVGGTMVWLVINGAATLYYWITAPVF